jgi:hypothetical protein
MIFHYEACNLGQYQRASDGQQAKMTNVCV